MQKETNTYVNLVPRNMERMNLGSEKPLKIDFELPRKHSVGVQSRNLNHELAIKGNIKGCPGS